HPRHAVLRDESTLRESRAEARTLRRPAQVAVERNHQAQAHRRPVNGGNHGFREAEKIGKLALKIRPQSFLRGAPGMNPPGDIFIQSLSGDGAQQGHVGAGAKSPARSRQHDHPYVFVPLRLLYCGTDLRFHGGGPGIQFVGTIQRDGCDSIRDFVDRLLRWHGHLPWTCSSAFSRRKHCACLRSPFQRQRPSRDVAGMGRLLDARKRLPQNAKRTPSWISRFGRAAVKPRGWLGETLAVPRTLNGGAKSEPTTLFTLA